MNDLSNKNSDFFDNSEGNNLLWQYVKSMQSEVIGELSKPSTEAAKVMEANLMGMLGNLPPDHFGVMITTSKENLGRLLASAMMNGYFLRNAEQRMGFERYLQAAAESSDTDR
ncbi:DUF760 domain-containing protein [Floridanema aerugineum]|jgi:hypothetical protein|uniref:DUF760 domain-containing protein n=1 Tax=Floridaenema aerugineum BLCC-F46 TaxID=3153654 RepID=A0ABV4XFQ0_9CYAN